MKMPTPVETNFNHHFTINKTSFDSNLSVNLSYLCALSTRYLIYNLNSVTCCTDKLHKVTSVTYTKAHILFSKSKKVLKLNYLTHCLINILENIRIIDAAVLVILFLLLSLSSPVFGKDSENFSFLQAAYNGSISENCPPRTYVRTEELMSIAIPSSAVRHGFKLRYSIASGNSEGFFTAEEEQVGSYWVLHIRTKTGHKDVLNRERRSEYKLKIIVKLLLNHPQRKSLETSTFLKIDVKDKNDNIPLFYPDTYSIEAAEDLLLNSPLTFVKAQDADAGINGQVYYALSNPSSDMFSVHPETGLVSVTSSLHSFYTKSFHFSVIAKDRGSRPKNMRESAVAEAKITVTIIRKNLYSPTISIKSLPTIIERANIRIYATIIVSDEDEGSNGDISSLEIVNGDPRQLFRIKQKKNEVNEFNLIVHKYFDKKVAPAGHNLTIRAIDGGSPPRSIEKSIFISLSDASNYSPIFLKEQYDESVSEDSPPNTPVVKIAAFNVNFNKNPLVTFRIVAGNLENKFEIHPETGLISTADWLDAESKTYYSLTVAAIDLTSSSMSKQSSAKVTIAVLDTNDNAPEFRTPNTEVTIDEEEPLGSYVTRVSATDSDSNENAFITYSISNQNDIPFSIDPFDGIIKTSAVIDFEEHRHVYTVIVRASDWGQPFKRETETTVKIKLRDINDNVPIFLQRDCFGWLDADTPIGNHVINLKAVDFDANDEITYKLTSKHLESCWSVDIKTGALTTSCDLKLNYLKSEKSISLHVNVSASDGIHVSEHLPLSLSIIDSNEINRKWSPISNENQVTCSSVNGSISLRNGKMKSNNHDEDDDNHLLSVKYQYNAHFPQFDDTTPSSIRLSEDTEQEQELFRVSAYDYDFGFQGRVVYAISSGDLDSVFSIDIHSGVVTLVGILDRERTSVYRLNITAYDLASNHRSSSKNITIYVLDVNDNSPEFTMESYSLHLSEDTTNGTSVAQLLALDVDEGENAEVTYELITKSTFFKLDSISGSLYLITNLDREMIDEFELRIRAWDNGKLRRNYSEVKVFVYVIDVNDCAPDFGTSSNLVISVPEDYPLGTVIATVKASDSDEGDGASVSYTLEEKNIGENKFRIDSQTGVVRISSLLDFESDQIHNLTIFAKDSGVPSLTSKTTLLVIVKDIYEINKAPKFADRLMQTWIKENEAPGTLVTALPVFGEGLSLFSITEGDGIGFFSISKNGEYHYH